MATDIAGLFTTPEQYQLAQQQAQQAQAIQFANLDPRAQAQYGFYRGGQQLGSAIGGALGGVDPQLQLITQRQQLASQLDPTNLDTYKLVAQNAANSGDTQFAMAVADAGRQAAIQIAQANKERQLAVPVDIQKIQMIPQINNAIAQYKAMPQTPEIQQQISSLESMLSVINPKPKAEATPNEIQIAQALAGEKGVKGTPEYNAEYLAQLTRLTTKEPKERNIAFGAEAERKSKATYGKSYADLTPEQAGLVDKAVEASEQAKAKAGAVLLPGQPAAPKDWLAFSSQISKDPVMDRTSTVIADAPNAIATIRMSTTNDIAANALPGALAQLTGQGKNMSNQDVNRFARTGGLDDRLASTAVEFFTGRKTNVSKQQAEQFATAVYRGALLERKKFLQDQAEQAGYDKTPNYAVAIRQLDDQLSKFKLVKPSDKKNEEPKRTISDDALINKYLPKKP
jgi:hypothetical protein